MRLIEELEAQNAPSIVEKIQELKQKHAKRHSEREKAIESLIVDEVSTLRALINRFNQQVNENGHDEV